MTTQTSTLSPILAIVADRLAAAGYTVETREITRTAVDGTQNTQRWIVTRRGTHAVSIDTGYEPGTVDLTMTYIAGGRTYTWGRATLKSLAAIVRRVTGFLGGAR